MSIDWDEFKQFKKEMPHLNGDNFVKLIYFIRSFYNTNNAGKIFDILNSDEISVLMLKKRGIDSAIKLEKYFDSI